MPNLELWRHTIDGADSSRPGHSGHAPDGSHTQVGLREPANPTGGLGYIGYVGCLVRVSLFPQDSPSFLNRPFDLFNKNTPVQSASEESVDSLPAHGLARVRGSSAAKR